MEKYGKNFTYGKIRKKLHEYTLEVLQDASSSS